jgi:hypothetical protein
MLARPMIASEAARHFGRQPAQADLARQVGDQEGDVEAAGEEARVQHQ